MHDGPPRRTIVNATNRRRGLVVSKTRRPDPTWPDRQILKVLKCFNFPPLYLSPFFPSFPPFSPSSSPQSLFCLIFWFPSFTHIPQNPTSSNCQGIFPFFAGQSLVLVRYSSHCGVAFLIHWVHYQVCASTISLIYISFLFFHAMHVSECVGVWYLTPNAC